jgi:uncharacterized protein YciI
MKSYLILICLFFSNGSFAQDNFMFVFLNTNNNREILSEEKVNELQKAHRENIGRLAAEKKLIIAGPFNGGGGIFILNTSSKEQAMEWLNTDAAIRAGRFILELYEYSPLIGSVCAVDGNNEMVLYNFVRFVPNLTKFNIQKESDLTKAHHEYLKELSTTGNVIAAGSLAGRAGTILVINGDLQRDVIEADPGVRGTLLETEFKSLYIAKGSFCEN